MEKFLFPVWSRPSASAQKRKAIRLFNNPNNLNPTQNKIMKKYLLTLALMTVAAFTAVSLRAQTATHTPAATTNAPVAAWTTNAPTSEQRLESTEAYFANTDP